MGTDPPPLDAEVLIVGAGPVGLTLALDLARHNVRTLLIEKRERPLRLPKMERSNPRSMEIYRRLGMADRIRAAAYPADEPMDILVLRSMTQPPLVHQKYPSVAATRARIAVTQDGSLPREPYQLVSQYTLEGLLLDELRSNPCVTVAMATELLHFHQDAAGVSAEVRSGEAMKIVRAHYLVGCDGAGSDVRRMLNIPMEGRKDLGTVTNVFFRSDDLLTKSRVPHARHYLFAGVDATGGAAGTIVVQDDMKHFGSHFPIVPGPGVDFSHELRKLTNLDINPEILFVGRWTQNMQVAQSHGMGRVFLAGDSNHIFIPAGGLGMNTGIVDAINLSWKLAATLQGWGGPNLLASYCDEREAVARRNLRAVAYAVDGVVAWRKLPVPAPLDQLRANDAAIRAYANAVEPLNRRVYEMHGTELGYRYESAVICAESGEPPADDSYDSQPTTWPGAHLPHVWLRDDVSIYDVLNGFSLLRLNPDVDTAPLQQALARYGVPFELIDVRDDEIRAVMQRDLLLVRPDLHVAWRGNALPNSPERVVATAIGL